MSNLKAVVDSSNPIVFLDIQIGEEFGKQMFIEWTQLLSAIEQ